LGVVPGLSARRVILSAVFPEVAHLTAEAGGTCEGERCDEKKKGGRGIRKKKWEKALIVPRGVASLTKHLAFSNVPQLVAFDNPSRHCEH